MAWKVSGERGEIRRKYLLVGEVSKWELDPIGTAWRLIGQFDVVDEGQLSQPALSFVVTRPDPEGPWVFPVQSLQVTGTTLTASLGPVQE